LRLSRTDSDEIDNLGGWLTTVVGRVCLDMLRSRKTRGEQPLDARPTDPASAPEGVDPEQEALLADSVGLAMLVVLEKLTPAERLAFVLHDMFAVPFDDIAPMIGRTSDAARQLASRARRRVQGSDPVPNPPLGQQREIIDAFIAAARGGDFDALVAVLDPDVILRADSGSGAPAFVRGAHQVASGAVAFRRAGSESRPVLVNGAVGIVALMEGRPVSVFEATFVNGRIATIDIVADPERAAAMELTLLD
jgi:RNA polymerase sigma-70 factor (ECF subfamily)